MSKLLIVFIGALMTLQIGTMVYEFINSIADKPTFTLSKGCTNDLKMICFTDIEERAKQCSEEEDLINSKPLFSCVKNKLSQSSRCEKCICPLSNQYGWMIQC